MLPRFNLLLKLPESADIAMAKPQRQLKKANHGQRPANSKARRAKRRAVKT